MWLRWRSVGFDDSTWAHGETGFGTAGAPGAIVGTTWQTDDIWLRREVNLPAKDYNNLEAWLHHDEDVEVYINGVLANSGTGLFALFRAWLFDHKARRALHRLVTVLPVRR